MSWLRRTFQARKPEVKPTEKLSETDPQLFQMEWRTKGAGTYAEKLLFDPNNHILITVRKAYKEVHIFSREGSLLQVVSLEDTFPAIKQQNEGYMTGSKRFGYQPECFAIGHRGDIYIGGRHDHLYVTDSQGHAKGQIPLSSDVWQQDITVDRDERIYVLYQSKGIRVVDVRGTQIKRFEAIGVYCCRSIAVNKKGEVFVSGVDRDITAWANCVRKISSEGVPKESIASLTNVGGLTVDTDDNIYIVEMNEGTLIKCDANLNEVQRLRLYGVNKQELSYVQAITLDADGNCCYVLEGNKVMKFRLPF